MNETKDEILRRMAAVGIEPLACECTREDPQMEALLELCFVALDFMDSITYNGQPLVWQGQPIAIPVGKGTLEIFWRAGGIFSVEVDAKADHMHYVHVPHPRISADP